MKIPAKDLGQLIEASYNPTIENVGKYTIIGHLSDDRVKVYTHPDGDEILVVHRGSADTEDWIDNAKFGLTNSVKGTPTYKQHLLKHKRAVSAYGADRIVAIGHSRAGLYVDQLYSDGLAGQAITYNKPTHLADSIKSVFVPTKRDVKHTDVRSKHDLVSGLGGFVRGKHKTVTLKKKAGYNPLTEHSSGRLVDDDGDRLIGQGVPEPSTDAPEPGLDGIFSQAIDWKKIRVKDLRQHVKANRHRLPQRVNITGLTKPELVCLAKMLV